MTVASNRTLCGAGSSLMALGFIGVLLSMLRNVFSSSALSIIVTFGVFDFLVGAVAFVGFILFFVGMYGLSKDYNAPGIFNNVIFGFIAALVTAVIVGIIVVIVIVAGAFSTSSSGSTNPLVSTVQNSSPQFPSIELISTPILNLAQVALVFFFMRAFNVVSNKTDVPLFKISAKLLLGSTALMAAVSVSFALFTNYGIFTLTNYFVVTETVSLIQYAAWGMLAMAFFRIVPPATPQPVMPPAYSMPPTPTLTPQVRYCTHCGAPNQVDSQFCTKCGQKLT
jgi:uncharacterized membrane protein